MLRQALEQAIETAPCSLRELERHGSVSASSLSRLRNHKAPTRPRHLREVANALKRAEADHLERAAACRRAARSLRLVLQELESSGEGLAMDSIRLKVINDPQYGPTISHPTLGLITLR